MYMCAKQSEFQHNTIHERKSKIINISRLNKQQTEDEF